MHAWLVRYRGYLFLSLIFVVSTSALVFVARRSEPKAIQITTPAPRPTTAPVPTATAANIVAQVNGAVNAPGLVYLTAGARVDDAVKAAGGATSEADLSRLNLARRVSDWELIVVPRLGDPTAAPAGTARERATATPTVLALVNINTASLEELDRLPGIGGTGLKEKRKAARIAIRERPEQNSINDAEHRGVRSDAERQSQNGNGREARVLANRP